jgi:U3 small nucleolar RNA-associated protein 12
MYLITAAKDTFLKLWDLSTQHCVQTQVAHRSEIWSMDIEQKDDKLLVLTGSGDGDVKAWNLDGSMLRDGIVPLGNGEVCSFTLLIIPILFPTGHL